MYVSAHVCVCVLRETFSPATQPLSLDASPHLLIPSVWIEREEKKRGEERRRGGDERERVCASGSSLLSSSGRAGTAQSG